MRSAWLVIVVLFNGNLCMAACQEVHDAGLTAKLLTVARPAVELIRGVKIKLRAHSVLLKRCDNEYVLAFEEVREPTSFAPVWLVRFNNEFTKIEVEPPM